MMHYQTLINGLVSLSAVFGTLYGAQSTRLPTYILHTLSGGNTYAIRIASTQSLIFLTILFGWIDQISDLVPGQY